MNSITSAISKQTRFEHALRRAMMSTMAVLLIWIATPGSVQAQCTVCKGAVETASNNGADGNAMADGINKGILFLFILPYCMIMMIAFIWYRGWKRKKREEAEELAASQPGWEGYGDLSPPANTAR